MAGSKRLPAGHHQVYAYVESMLCEIDMALSEFEIKRYEKLVSQYVKNRRPPPHIRNELDLDFRINGHSVEIFEVRPVWREPGVKIESPVAKATYVKTQKIWKIYWQRADLKWHRYEPDPAVKKIEDFLAVVERDEYGCFYG